MRQRPQDPIFLIFVIALLAALAPVSALALEDTPDASAPNVATIVARMVRAQAENRARMHPYMVNRTYQVFGHGEHEKSKSEVTANIQFLPPNRKSYTIDKSSGGTAENVVRKALEKEVELSKDPSITAMNGENYDFSLIGEETNDGVTSYVLGIAPRRETKELLKGKIWVDKSNYLVRRVEGEPGKTPSWWVRSVHLVITFAENGGMWLQNSSVAKANLRIVGLFTMVSRDEVVPSESLAEVTVSAKPTLANVTPASYRSRRFAASH